MLIPYLTPPAVSPLFLFRPPSPPPIHPKPKCPIATNPTQGEGVSRDHRAIEFSLSNTLSQAVMRLEKLCLILWEGWEKYNRACLSFFLLIFFRPFPSSYSWRLISSIFSLVLQTRVRDCGINARAWEDYGVRILGELDEFFARKLLNFKHNNFGKVLAL
jgi:hypothetical protein